MTEPLTENEIEATISKTMAPFEPYIKRYGFGYLHFHNGGALFTNAFIDLVRKLWDEDPIRYKKNVDEWYAHAEVEK